VLVEVGNPRLDIIGSDVVEISTHTFRRTIPRLHDQAKSSKHQASIEQTSSKH